MKTCPVCALEMENSYLFCSDDGASLSASPGDSSAQPVGTGTEEEDATNMLLFCPACGAGYPLTFSSCPVHGMPLTNQRLRSTVEKPATGSAGVPLNVETIALDRPASVTVQNSTATCHSGVSFGSGVDVHSTKLPIAEGIEHTLSNSETCGIAASAPEFPHHAVLPDHPLEADRPGFRVAAIATMIALAIFGVTGLYALMSNLSRRPSPATRPADQIEAAQAIPFVVTPQEVLEHKEEQPATPASESSVEAPPAAGQKVERERKESLSLSNERRGSVTPTARSVAAPYSQLPPARAISDVSEPPAPPRSNSSEFDSRLVRARSSRTSAGYRYDLTFNMQEQLGRWAQWQRVLITTRSASGSSHTQAIPFVHRLGATGALTFTISVELTGRSETDWRGRINCTTLGWDNNGSPLQASFTANVTP